jgi:C-terminal processing protease CtpA/Prc
MKLVRFDAATRRPLGELRVPAGRALQPQQQHCDMSVPFSYNTAGLFDVSVMKQDGMHASKHTVQAEESDEKVGIGATLGLNERGEVVVEDLADGWPAAFSALLARGDVLLQVDRTPLSTLIAHSFNKTQSERLADVRKAIVGPPNSVVALRVRHKDGRSQEVQLIRQKGPPRVQTSGSFSLDASSDHGDSFSTPDSKCKSRNGVSPHSPQHTQAGLGILFELMPPNCECRVTSLVHGGAAFLAGNVREHDIIMSIDSVSVTGLAHHQIMRAMQGPDKTRVTLGSQEAFACFTSTIVQKYKL